MKLPSSLSHNSEWVFLGPMGPALPHSLVSLPAIAVDGGARFSEKTEIWVGDADSFDGNITSRHVFRHNIEKDQSDLSLAFSLMDGPLRYKIHLWGFTGGRKDHELFNLGEAMKFLDEHEECQVLFYGPDGKVLFHGVGSGHWKFTYEGLFSLGTLKKTTVKLTGACQYLIPKTTELTPLSSFGLSNIGQGEIILEAGGAVFLCFPEGQ